MLVIEKSEHTDKQRKSVPVSNVSKNSSQTYFSEVLILHKKSLLFFQQILSKYSFNMSMNLLIHCPALIPI